MRALRHEGRLEMIDDPVHHSLVGDEGDELQIIHPFHPSCLFLAVGTTGAGKHALGMAAVVAVFDYLLDVGKKKPCSFSKRLSYSVRNCSK
jgi:hypothetical protein